MNTVPCQYCSKGVMWWSEGRLWITTNGQSRCESGPKGIHEPDTLGSS